jgi:hypothetical protein
MRDMSVARDMVCAGLLREGLRRQTRGRLTDVRRTTRSTSLTLGRPAPPASEHSLNPYELERLRRSIVMLQPGQPAGLDREDAMRLLAETQRLQHQLADIMARLREIGGEGAQ